MPSFTIDQMNLPELVIPFKPRIHPQAETAEALARTWAIEHGLLQSEKALKRYDMAKFSRLNGRTYPDGSLDALRIGNEWALWLFMHDDHCDEAQVGKDPDKLAAYHNMILDMAYCGELPQIGVQPPLVSSLLDLLHRGYALADTAWVNRFLTYVADYFEGCQWEARNRFEHRVPDIAEYMAGRDKASAVHSCLICGDLTIDAQYLPDDLREDEDMRLLALLTNRVVSWVNDIFSLEKEYKRGDVHNLVIVLQHHYGCSWQEALEMAAETINAAVSGFVTVENTISAAASEFDNPIKRQRSMYRSWMRGNLDWSMETLRYHTSYIIPEDTAVDYLEEIL